MVHFKFSYCLEIEAKSNLYTTQQGGVYKGQNREKLPLKVGNTSYNAACVLEGGTKQVS